MTDTHSIAQPFEAEVSRQITVMSPSVMRVATRITAVFPPSP